MPGELVDLGFQVAHAGGEVVAQPLQFRRVDADAVALHPFENRHQRAFQRLVDGDELFLDQARLEQRMQAQRHVGVLGGIVARGVQRHAVEGHLRLAAADHLLVLDRLVAEMQQGQFVHAVAVRAAFEHDAQQHGVVDRRDVDAVTDQYLAVVLDVLADLENRIGFQQRLEKLDRRLQRYLRRARRPNRFRPSPKSNVPWLGAPLWASGM